MKKYRLKSREALKLLSRSIGPNGTYYMIGGSCIVNEMFEIFYNPTAYIVLTDPYSPYEGCYDDRDTEYHWHMDWLEEIIEVPLIGGELV